MTIFALDLFCGAGGATRGLQNAGFHVTGVDLKRSPRYVGDRFIQANALDLSPEFLGTFDFIWASPPCQAHTAMKTMHNAKRHKDLIDPTRNMLSASGVPYVIENVSGAPLRNAIVLCGTMFNLGCRAAELHRHREFEASFFIPARACRHVWPAVIGIYGGHVRDRRRAGPHKEAGLSTFTFANACEAMGIDWMTLTELCQAIPPAYAEYIALAFLGRGQAERIAA